MAVVVDAKADRRRDWALILIGGGAMVFTLYSAVTLYMLRENPGFVFYLALAAHLHILIALTGILGLLVKRELKISKNEINISDHNDDDLIPRPEAAKAVEEALEEVPAIIPSGTNNKPS